MVQKSKENIVYDTVNFHLTSGQAIFDKLAFKGTKRWRKEPPEQCPYCCATEIQGVEILGAKDGALFWECDTCAERMLRFTQVTTIKYLDKTVDLYVDLEGLANIWEQLPN